MKVTMECKIFTNNFPRWCNYKHTNGEEILRFLLSSCNCAYTKEENEKVNSQSLPGDYNVWYLATNEKFGRLQIFDTIMHYDRSWGVDESSWEIVIEFVNKLKELNIFNDSQYDQIMEVINEGKHEFISMYDIPDYLVSKEKS